jgi:hypothetical protein
MTDMREPSSSASSSSSKQQQQQLLLSSPDSPKSVVENTAAPFHRHNTWRVDTLLKQKQQQQQYGLSSLAPVRQPDAVTAADNDSGSKGMSRILVIQKTVDSLPLCVTSRAASTVTSSSTTMEEDRSVCHFTAVLGSSYREAERDGRNGDTIVAVSGAPFKDPNSVVWATGEPATKKLVVYNHDDDCYTVVTLDKTTESSNLPLADRTNASQKGRKSVLVEIDKESYDATALEATGNPDDVFLEVVNKDTVLDDTTQGGERITVDQVVAAPIAGNSIHSRMIPSLDTGEEDELKCKQYVEEDTIAQLVLSKQYGTLWRTLQESGVSSAMANGALHLPMGVMTGLEFSIYTGDYQMSSIFLASGADPTNNSFCGCAVARTPLFLESVGEDTVSPKHLNIETPIPGFAGLRTLVEPDAAFRDETLAFLWLMEIARGSYQLDLRLEFPRVLSSLRLVCPERDFTTRLKASIYETMLACLRKGLCSTTALEIAGLVTPAAVWSFFTTEVVADCTIIQDQESDSLIGKTICFANQEFELVFLSI